MELKILDTCRKKMIKTGILCTFFCILSLLLLCVTFYVSCFYKKMIIQLICTE